LLPKSGSPTACHVFSFGANYTVVIMKFCIVKGCEKKQHVRLGYCSTHYAKFKAHGDPLGGRKGSSPGAPLKWIHDNANYSGEDCIIWPFQLSCNGYGSIKHNGKKRVASRVMCEVAHGIPENEALDAAHQCGNGASGCMNPLHLSWKTRTENCADKKLHGTNMQGEDVSSSVITENQAEQIILMAMNHPEMLHKDISKSVQCSSCIVGKVLRGDTWRDVSKRLGYYPVKMPARGEKSGNSKLSEDDVREIRSLVGIINNEEIAKRFGIGKDYVSKIHCRRWWAWLT